MKLRTRLALLSALAVAAVIVVAAIGAAKAAEREFLAEIDETLLERADLVPRLGDLAASGQLRVGRGLERFGPNNPFGRGGSDELFQIVRADGQLGLISSEEPLPADEVDLRIAQGYAAATIRSVSSDDGRYRILTVPVNGGAVQVARSLAEFDASTARLARTLTIAGGVGVALAGVAGLLVAKSALKPVDQLTETVEHVATTQELGARIAVERNDEVGRLAMRFNEMLEALQSSRVQQERLVRDAGHELRTPLTALRTNVELLARGHGMTDEQRSELLLAATAELEELTTLTAELVELAADPSAPTERSVEVDLGELAERVAERFRKRSQHTIVVTADDSMVIGRLSELETAVGNLVDNAIKWSPQAEPITITVDSRSIAVDDAGTGIPHGDLGRVFDRFYRSDTARTTPGSGLGLAIVRKIVEGHGGTVFAEASQHGGASVGFRLPAA